MKIKKMFFTFEDYKNFGSEHPYFCIVGSAYIICYSMFAVGCETIVEKLNQD